MFLDYLVGNEAEIKIKEDIRAKALFIVKKIAIMNTFFTLASVAFFFFVYNMAKGKQEASEEKSDLDPIISYPTTNLTFDEFQRKYDMKRNTKPGYSHTLEDAWERFRTYIFNNIILE